MVPVEANKDISLLAAGRHHSHRRQHRRLSCFAHGHVLASPAAATSVERARCRVRETPCASDLASTRGDPRPEKLPSPLIVPAFAFSTPISSMRVFHRGARGQVCQRRRQYPHVQHKHIHTPNPAVCESCRTHSPFTHEWPCTCETHNAERMFCVHWTVLLFFLFIYFLPLSPLWSQRGQMHYRGTAGQYLSL